MILPFNAGLVRTWAADPECAALADRHYSRQHIGAAQFAASGRKIILRDTSGLILFVWLWCDPALRMDRQVGYNCAIFRNETDRRSSDVILEAETIACEVWGPHRLFTYVDPARIRSVNPGYCFKRAGWRFARRNVGGKHLLEKDLR
jgi:hypothetical protein